MNLYELVQKLCIERNITIAALERELSFGNGTIKKWSNTVPSGDRLAKVADYFNVSVDYLLGRDVIENVYFSFAKEAKENHIDPSDIRLALDTIKRLRKRED